MKETKWHFQNEYFDRQSCNGKQSFRKCRCCESLCSELLLNLNLCHINTQHFTWLLLLMFSSFIATLHLVAMRSCCSGGALCISLNSFVSLSFSFVEVFKLWVPNIEESILLHLSVHFRTFSMLSSSCFMRKLKSRIWITKPVRG